MVLERSQNLFTVNHARIMVAMDKGKHGVLVLEKGQNFFTVDHARAMVVMESISTTCSYSQQVKTYVAPTMRERWWRWKS
jgi:hypothetical protein